MRWLVVILSVLLSARGAFSATPTSFDMKKITASEFKALPDSSLVELDGRKMTKAQFMAEMEAHRTRMSAIKPPSDRKAASLDFSVMRARILDKEKSRIAAKNARVNAVSQEHNKMPPTPTPDPCTQPKITAISGAPPLEPGEQVILNGCGFGLKNPASELRWISNDFPGGFLKLQILQWQGNAILAVVPPVSGVKDQPAKLQVVRKDLQVSNEWPAAFYAMRVVTKLWHPDVTHTCSQASSSVNHCSNYEYGYTLSGEHEGAGLSLGTDSVTANLKNGCVLAGAAWEWGGDGTLMADPTTTLVWGSASISMLFPWLNLPNPPTFGSIWYDMDLYALGPNGVPCH